LINKDNKYLFEFLDSSIDFLLCCYEEADATMHTYKDHPEATLKEKDIKH